MITGFITRWAEENKYFPPAFDRAVKFIDENDPTCLKPGKYPIDGEKIYAIVQHPTTEPAVTRPFEIHRDYIDIQILIQGHELQGFHPLLPVCAPMKDDLAENDIAFYPIPTDAQYITLSPTQYVIYFPGEQHSPICAVHQPENIIKVVLKIRADSL